MPNRENFIFAVIMLAALIIVLYATGAGALLLQLGTTMMQAILSFFQALIRK